MSGPLFVILMHPKERKDRAGTGTGRITHLSISNSVLLEGLEFEGHPVVDSVLKDRSLQPCLLYPGPGAIDLETNFLEYRKANPGALRPAVFVIDGSWSCSLKLLKRNQWLLNLPKVSFTATHESRYTFKKQPHAECLSTLEAVYSLIDIFNKNEFFQTTPKDGHQTLVEVFSSMVEYQVSCTGRRYREGR